MARLVQSEQSQPYLLPPDLRDWLPEDDLAHFVVEAVERAPMSAFEVNERGTGSAQYHPRTMLAMLVYCYANGIFGSRRIEIDTGLQQVAGAQVAHDMRCDRPVGQRRHVRRASLDEPIDPEPGIGPAMAADEDVVIVCPSVNEFAKGVLGTWPQRTLTDLASLAAEGNERMAAITPAELKIADLQSRRLRDPRASVVEKQQQGVFGSAPRRTAVGNREQSFHLVPGDPGDRTRHGFLGCDGVELRAPVEMGRVAA